MRRIILIIAMVLGVVGCKKGGDPKPFEKPVCESVNEMIFLYLRRVMSVGRLLSFWTRQVS